MRRFVFVLILGIISSAACSGTRVSDDPPESTSATDVRISAEGLSASESGIAARDDGGVTVVWSERDASGRFDVYVRAFDAALKPLAERVRVNPNPGEAKTWYGDPPTIAVSGQNVYVGWNRIYSDGSSGNDLMLSSSTDGGPALQNH